MGNKTNGKNTFDKHLLTGRMIFAAILFLSGCLLLPHCADPNTDAPDVNRAHPASWTNPIEKGTPAYHGTYVAVNTPDSCRQCHGPDLEGNGEISGCADVCHFGVAGQMSPAGSGWTHAVSPHSDIKLVDRIDICNQCHSILRQYGLAPDTCHDCHGPGINHPLGRAWLDYNSIEFHGRSDQECSPCHNPDTYCYQCHFGASGSFTPSGSGWVHGNNPQHEDYSGDMAICNKCHEVDRSFGNPPALCHDCHPITPAHPLGQAWLDPMITGFHGQSSLDCTDCHYPSTDCTVCHFDATGSRTPPGSNWTHGNNDNHKNFEPFQDVCNACHDLNRSFNNPPVSCHDCHPTVTHPLGQIWLDPKSPQHHGQSGLDCADCHALATDCTVCHFDAAGSRAPVGSNWTHGRNDRHESFEIYQNVCTRCHSLNRSYGNPPASCHDCHGDGGDGDD